ncbi:dihydroorotate dehydrogenase [Paenibacillus sp. FSL R7-0048]|jgi:dihydroorotate dehydrogenase (NAD+) catalytic subunit|uniref:Dihydroorotate dehydrogenase n=1 Tax=Paenibacillus odorifer TaxID=189426 RepID=A0A1R0Z6B6_9BACL|nr:MULTISPECIES: dihydroorotate dehydrogenase [Paenibacillus]AWV34061.1 dihydroorotate dehydrogenase B catalytic subunit [Paenibacillus odorifer]MDH6428518.1 dihydroorotate dehydrogenase (NAD+) catalytic subunit [Paenibacillus sp. PastH-4]MDH6443847.1 dihydroorotate dehydrogenase (NAD+) catalytic subunit [Paenibacillus sp. PastF-4]MDH6527752.1 dihydroorotate dehydrogenase (NAD+) catalytic subunit [Paenibacillus sp. PastH-3]OMC79036.1 dihydroorotate dehydrogenase B catalytic subunit [Paenibacil
MTKLNTTIAGVHFKNPIIMASGTFGFGREYGKLYDVSLLGGISGKGLTLNPKAGNPGTRVYETASGMLNSVGLENPGVAAFLDKECPYWETLDTARLVNLGGGTLEDYVLGAEMIQRDADARASAGKTAVDMIELNISCPNVKEGGIAFGIQTSEAQKVVQAVRRATKLPLAVKLSPGAENIVEMAQMCQEEGADAVSLINTISGMKIDVRRRSSVFNNLYAGLSGPAIKPVALRMVHQVAQNVTIPVIGMGGITSATDIIEFIMAGAAVIQVGTYNFMNLRAGSQLVAELEQFMVEENIQSLEEIRGII